MSWNKLGDHYQTLQGLVDKIKPNYQSYLQKPWFLSHPVASEGPDYNPLLSMLSLIPANNSVYASFSDNTGLLQAFEQHFQGFKYYSYPIPLDNPSVDKHNWKQKYPFSVLVGPYLSNDPTLAWNDGDPTKVDDRLRHFQAVASSVDLYAGLSGLPHLDLELAAKMTPSSLLLKFPTLFDHNVCGLLIWLHQQYPDMQIVFPDHASVFHPQYYVYIPSYSAKKVPSTLPCSENEPLRAELVQILKAFKERIGATVKS